MNTPVTEIKRWGIIVIQSLNPEDKKTGENLYNDILQYKEFSKKESFSYFYEVHSILEFRSAINDIENLLVDGDILTLQIETHGCDKGIGLSNGEILEWKEFYDLIRPINIKIGHLLFVILAMCKSIAMLSSLNPTERAPYRVFICTTRDVSSYEIERGFEAFYENYFNLLDITEALKAMQEGVKDENGYSRFQMLSAEDVFNETFNPNRDISDLVDNQLERLNIPKTEATKSIMSDSLRNLLKEIHDKYYDYYNFRDLY